MDTLNCFFHCFKNLIYCCDCCDCLRQKKLSKNNLEGLSEYMKNAKRIIVMTGAGISTNAGIPDFRSPSFGLYNRLAKYHLSHPTDVFNYDYFKINPKPFYDIAHELYPVLSKAKPTLAHHFIKLLDDKGVLLRHYTQNIDGLEDLTNLDSHKTIQAHGHIRSGTCLNCDQKFSFEYMKNFVLNEEIPTCDKCSGVIKPDVVLFGEGLPRGFAKYLFDFPKCDLLIIMGTSLVVQPFAGLAEKVDYNTPRLLINRDPVGDSSSMFGSTLTKLMGFEVNFNPNSRNSRDVFYQGDCDKGCQELADLLGWGDELRAMIDKYN